MRLRRRRDGRDPDLVRRREALALIDWDELEADPDAYVEKMRRRAWEQLEESTRQIRRLNAMAYMAYAAAFAINVWLGFWSEAPWSYVNFGTAGIVVLIAMWSERNRRVGEKGFAERRARLDALESGKRFDVGGDVDNGLGVGDQSDQDRGAAGRDGER